MNVKELKQFIESRGYTEVTVKDFENSCRIHYCTAVDSITLNLRSKVSDLPMSWLNKRFEPLLRVGLVHFQSSKDQGANKMSFGIEPLYKRITDLEKEVGVLATANEQLEKHNVELEAMVEALKKRGGEKWEWLK